MGDERLDFLRLIGVFASGFGGCDCDDDEIQGWDDVDESAAVAGGEEGGVVFVLGDPP